MKFASFILLIFLAGCIMQTQTVQEGKLAARNPGESCIEHAQCQTPEEYLIRSLCPYTSMCIEGTCGVVCPQSTGDLPEKTCSTDSQCKCDTFSSRGTCECIDGQCVIVVP